MKREISIVLYTGLILLSEVGCKPHLEPAAFVQYIRSNEHGLKKVINVDGWEYTVQYKPNDLILLTEFREAKNGKAIEERRKQLQGTAWFNISIKREDGSVSPLRYNLAKREEYDSRLDYFLNHAAKDIGMVYGKDTLAPLAYEFENNYNLTPQETMMVGFSIPKSDIPEEDMKISFNDRVFKNGIIKATFKKEDLKNIPNLTF